jgi:penicillin amidase
VPGVYGEWRHLQDYLLADLDALSAAERSALLQAAAAVALDRAAGYPTWGDMHRLSVQHILGNLPVVGGRFVYDDVPIPGSRETLWKSAHDLIEGRHDAQYGAQSRHISDMADPDANWFVLLGGQDGWLGSTTQLDQVELFTEGRMIRVPLRPETVAETFPHALSLTPDGPGS